MNSKVLLISLFIFSLSTLPAQACSSGNTQLTEYMRRDNNRCEGIHPRDVASGLRLISFTTRNISTYPSRLTLQIPNLDNSTPEVTVQSLGKSYLLDNLSLMPSQSRFTFSFDSYVLNKEQIPPASLRALASVNLNSLLVYLPVTIGQSSGQYQFVFYTPNRAKFSTIQILHNGKVVYSNPRNNFQRGEVVFTWNGRNAPAGRYELYIVADQEQTGRPPEEFEQSFTFEHSPNWLK